MKLEELSENEGGRIDELINCDYCNQETVTLEKEGDCNDCSRDPHLTQTGRFRAWRPVEVKSKGFKNLAVP